jgi:hypothetical protein
MLYRHQTTIHWMVLAAGSGTYNSVPGRSVVKCVMKCGGGEQGAKGGGVKWEGGTQKIKFPEIKTRRKNLQDACEGEKRREKNRQQKKEKQKNRKHSRERGESEFSCGFRKGEEDRCVEDEKEES